MTWVFFSEQPRSKIPSIQNLLGWLHSYSSHHFIWTISWIDWKKIFVIMSAKFDNDMSIFFVNSPDEKFLLFQYLVGSVHTYTSPHFIWTSPWLDWKTLFVILHTDNFRAQSLTTTWIPSFVDNPDQKYLLFQNLLGWLHSYSSHHFIWTSSWLEWKKRDNERKN